jgi:hypothetical protein
LDDDYLARSENILMIPAACGMFDKKDKLILKGIIRAEMRHRKELIERK